MSDDGIGFPHSLQAGLFERFTKARRPGLRGEVTQGLGLSIVKHIIEMHGGKVWVEREENKEPLFYRNFLQHVDQSFILFLPIYLSILISTSTGQAQ